MTDYNSIKADEYAQRQGEMDEFDNAVDEMVDLVILELPGWLRENNGVGIYSRVLAEAKRRVMHEIKERSEP